MLSRSRVLVEPLGEQDRVAWQRLARGYNDFYETVLGEGDYEQTWQRLRAGTDIHALGARLNGRLVGIAHYLFHAGIWRESVCYLQDLFVDEAARGQGVARALIDAVAAAARRRGAARFYWQTKYDNTRARALYEKVAVFRGFIRYDYLLD
ncbi:MAG TPA: GNAT family N-acetyltransferase [Reyranella sp.]|nr:GNAT family N-acetyltransferase [Reyranella sp.]